MHLAKINEWVKDDKLILLRGWARDGLTNEQIAKNIGINPKTLYEWKNKESKISNVLKESREVADYEVENALYEVEADKEQLTRVEELLSKIEEEANK